MSEHDSTDDPDLGPMPDAEIEPGEPNPGGVDAIDGGDEADVVPRDLDPDDNPAVEDALPDEMKQGEDTTTEATKDGQDSDDADPSEESPA